MRIVLVQPPSNYEETFLLSPPLGLLSVAAAAENEGAEVTLLDFNLKGLQDQRWQTAEYFYPHAVELIEQARPDIVGFTSMAIESHVCLETAKLLKERNPDIITLFGGPHFGAIATEVLQNYEWTDYVIAGEGEAPLQNLIRYLEGHKSVATMDNIAYRENEEIIFNRRSMSGRDLDELPFPAYHLVDMEEYFALNPNKLVCFEHARGCFLKCSFCYSPQHWGHGESRKSIERVLAEMRQLKEMGIEELFWVSDNLLNSKENAISLCNAIKETELQFKWHCYGTTAQITEPVVKALSSAGCQSIFVGVDAVAEDNKKKYKKSYFKGWDDLREKLSMCLTNGITPTCAFMLSPLDTDEARESTLRIAALCANSGCFVRLNALTYYNQTEILSQKNIKIDNKYSEAYATVLFDTAPILNSNEYAKKLPEFFPFHRTFSDIATHEDFAGYCRLAMKIVNQNQFLITLGFLEHEISIHTLISAIRSGCELDEIKCQEISSPQSLFRVSNLFTSVCIHLGLPADIILLDAFANSREAEKKKYLTLFIDGTSIKCLTNQFKVIESKVSIDTKDIQVNIEPEKYLVQKINGHLNAIKMSRVPENFPLTKIPVEGAELTRGEFSQLVGQKVLTPVFF